MLQSEQTLGVFTSSHGRALKRNGLLISAPTGQTLIVLPEKPAGNVLVLEGVDLGRHAALPELQHRVADHLLHHLDAPLADDAAVLVPHDQRAEVIVLDVDLRLRHAADRRCRARTCGPAARTRRPCRRPGSRAGG